MHFMYGGKEDLELVISAVLHCSSLGAVFSFARWKEEDNIFYQFLRVLKSLFFSLAASKLSMWGSCEKSRESGARNERRVSEAGHLFLDQPMRSLHPPVLQISSMGFFNVFLYGG